MITFIETYISRKVSNSNKSWEVGNFETIYNQISVGKLKLVDNFIEKMLVLNSSKVSNLKLMSATSMK